MCSAEYYYFWDQKGATSNCKTRFFFKELFQNKLNIKYKIDHKCNLLPKYYCMPKLDVLSRYTKILANQLLIDCVIILKVDTIYQSQEPLWTHDCSCLHFLPFLFWSAVEGAEIRSEKKIERHVLEPPTFSITLSLLFTRFLFPEKNHVKWKLWKVQMYCYFDQKPCNVRKLVACKARIWTISKWRTA